jgi:hypothetical protein
MKEILYRQNSQLFLTKFLCWQLPESLVDVLRMIITQMGMHNTSEMVALHGMLCVIPPHNSNSNIQNKGPGMIYQIKVTHHACISLPSHTA